MQGADANTIEKVNLYPQKTILCYYHKGAYFLCIWSVFQIVKEGYKLSDILNDITKEDLRYLGLR